jgi:pimeloyl-ACP methyl ester carboxylesterase
LFLEDGFVAMLELGEAHQIYYELIDGAPEKPYLVFLHDALGCTAMWKNFPRRLCHETACPGLVYDRLGCGQSSPLTKPRTAHYLRDYALNELREMLAHLIPDRDYFLIGHSDGGSIGLIFAAEKPPRLRGLITEAAHVLVEEETLAGIRVAAEAYRAGKMHGVAKYHGDKTDGIFRAWADTWLADWFRHWNIKHLLPSIECPVLAIQGTEDQYGTADQVDSIASTVMHGRKTMVEGCGHIPHHEQPDVVFTSMRDFLLPLIR